MSDCVMLLDGGLSERLCELVAPQKLHKTLWSAGLLVDVTTAAHVERAHLEFLDAGADIIETVGYQATVAGFLKAGLASTRIQAVKFIKDAEGIAMRAIEKWKKANPDSKPNPLRQGMNRCRVWQQTDHVVALSVGPYGAYLADGSEYTGNYSVSEQVLEEFHKSTLDALLLDSHNHVADVAGRVLAFETFPNVNEAVVVCNIMRDSFPNVPFWISFQCKPTGTTASGTTLKDACESVLCASGISITTTSCGCTNTPGSAHLVGIGVNCCHPSSAVASMKEISQNTPGWFEKICYPNKGESWDGESKTWSSSSPSTPPSTTTAITTPSTIATTTTTTSTTTSTPSTPSTTSTTSTTATHASQSSVLDWIDAGATIVGGCCRVGPVDTRRMQLALQTRRSP